MHMFTYCEHPGSRERGGLVYTLASVSLGVIEILAPSLFSLRVDDRSPCAEHFFSIGIIDTFVLSALYDIRVCPTSTIEILVFNDSTEIR